MRVLVRLMAICILLQATACAVIEDTKRADLKKINKKNYKKLSGRYSNRPDAYQGFSESSEDGKSFIPKSMWRQLAGYDGGIKEGWTVSIEFQSKTRAVAKLYEQDKLIAGKIIKGRIRKGYFYRRPYFIGIPFIPLVFGYKTYRYRLALSDDNNLVIDFRWNYYAFAIAAGSYSEGQSHEVFTRLE
jgi:hypothetical protein